MSKKVIVGIPTGLIAAAVRSVVIIWSRGEMDIIPPSEGGGASSILAGTTIGLVVRLVMDWEHIQCVLRILIKLPGNS